MPPTAIRRRPLLPLAEFLRSESAGGAVLIVPAVMALVWANSPAGDAYRGLLRAEIGPMPGSTPTSVPMKTPMKQ